MKIKDYKGITLIAMIITIIVMLVLAGVSMNAIVGDNGILDNAISATTATSIAVLQEYFNELYVDIVADEGTEGDTALDTIIINGYKTYFFSTSDGACLKKIYTDDSGTSQTLVLYLIKKDQLPEEIQSQIQGSNDRESRDYRKLNDIYGITSDLKVYYCSSGLDSIYGLTIADLNADSPDIIYADSTTALALAVNGGTADITNQGLKNINSITIDSSDEIDALGNFSKLTNLKTVNFSGLTLDNIDGIEGASSTITYVKFTSCTVSDYSALCDLSNLAQLYIVTPTGYNQDIINLGSSEYGIASAEFSKLKYFGIVGNASYLNSSSTNYYGTRYAITDISPIANFSTITKEAITYMNLQNLQLTSIAALKDFKNVYFLRMEENALTTFDGIQNMWNLHYLIAPSCYSSATASYTLGTAESTSIANSTIDALSYIYKNSESKNTTLYYVDLRYETQLKWVTYLSTCSAIKYLYLAGCSSMCDVSTIADVLGNCGSNYSLDGTYGKSIISSTTTVLSLASSTLTISEFEQLKNKTSLTHLNLQNIKITTDDGITTLSATTSPTLNEEINSVLSTCTNLQYLNLCGLSGLTTIDFVGDGKCTKLIEFGISNTNISDLTNLNSYANDLEVLYIGDCLIDLTTIQSTINRLEGWYSDNLGSKARYWFSSSNYREGLTCSNSSTLKFLSSCYDLTNLRISGDNNTDSFSLDLTECTNLTRFEAICLPYCTVYLPNSCTYVYTSAVYPPIIAENSGDYTMYQNHWKGSINETVLKNAIASLKNASSIDTLIIGSGIANFSCAYFQYCSGATINNLTIGWRDASATAYCSNLEGLNYVGGSLETLYLIYNTSGTSLKGIEYCTNLKNLYLNNSSISDISYLSGLTNLEKIYLQNNSIIDISSLANMTKLNYADLSNNMVSDISSLENKTQLTYLNLNDNEINDIYVLKTCTNLETLYLQNNSLSDFSSHNGVGYETMDIFYDLNYEKKGALKNLYISGNNIDDTEILLDLNWSNKSGF